MLEQVPTQITEEPLPLTKQIEVTFQKILTTESDIKALEEEISKLEKMPMRPALVGIINDVRNNLNLAQELLTNLQVLKESLVEEKRIVESGSKEAEKLRVAGLGEKFDLPKEINTQVWNEVGVANGNTEVDSRVHGDLDPFSEAVENENGGALRKMENRAGF